MWVRRDLTREGRFLKEPDIWPSHHLQLKIPPSWEGMTLELSGCLDAAHVDRFTVRQFVKFTPLPEMIVITVSDNDRDIYSLPPILSQKSLCSDTRYQQDRCLLVMIPKRHCLSYTHLWSVSP